MHSSGFLIKWKQKESDDAVQKDLLANLSLDISLRWTRWRQLEEQEELTDQSTNQI